MFDIQTVQVDSIDGKGGDAYITDVLEELVRRVSEVLDKDREHDAHQEHSIQLLVVKSPDERFLWVGTATIHRVPKQ